MTRAIAALLTVITCCYADELTPAKRADALFREVEQLIRSNRKDEAMAKAGEGVIELDRAVAAKEKIGRAAMDGLRRAAGLARADFLDFEKSLFFSNKLFECSDSDYWRTPASLERALTYRAMGEFEKARQEYEAIVASGERYAPTTLLPRAEMVYSGLKDRERGRRLIEQALMSDKVNSRERYGALMHYAQAAMVEGNRDEALQWYAMLGVLPNSDAGDRDRALSRAWYEMGRIEESRGRTSEAKALYRKAMALDSGDMRYRARARDALEAIEYFE